MDIKGKFGKIKDFFAENTTRAVIILCSSLIAVLLVILIILLIVNYKKSIPVQESEIILTETQIIPDGPEMQTDYVISRKTKEKWSEEEVEEWFTVPTLKDVENLGKSNDLMVNDILGNAP